MRSNVATEIVSAGREPEAEFQETVNQSKAMLKAVARAETFSL